MIQANVLVRNISQKTVKDKPLTKKVDRGSFIAETFPVKGPTIVISNQTVAGLTIETNQVLHARAISKALNHEPIVTEIP